MRRVRFALALALASALPLLASAAEPTQAERRFDDPLFRRCITWMLDGTRGAMIQNLCVDDYGIPQPSLFLCARKVHLGFASPEEQEGCAIVFEEEAKKARAGFVR